MKKMMMALVLAPLAFTEISFAAPMTSSEPAGVNAGQVETQVARPRRGHRPGRRCHPGYVRRCNYIRTPIGIVIRQCRNVWSSCARRGWNVANVDQVTNAMAEKYDLTYEDADAMITAIDEAKDGNPSTLNALSAEIGLDQATVETMAADLN